MSVDPKSARNRFIIQITQISLFGALIFALIMLAPLPEGRFWGWDAAVFRAGAKAFFNGQNPYQADNIFLYSDGAELATIPNFTYTPISLFFFGWLAIFPPALAFRFWFFANLVFYFSSVFLLMDALKWRVRSAAFLWLMVFFATWAPLRTLLIIGQSTAVMLFFLSLSLWLLSRNKGSHAGIALSLAYFKPHLILLVLYLAIQRRWRLLLVFFISFGAALLPFFFWTDDWVRTVFVTRLENIQYGCVDFSSLPMLITCLSPASVENKVIVGLFLGFFTGLTFWLLRQQSALNSNRFLVQVSLVVMFSLLILDNIRVADQVLIVFPLVILLYNLGKVNNPWVRRALAGLIFGAWLFPYMADLLAMVTQNLMWTLAIWYTFPALLLYLAVAVLLVSNFISEA